MSNRQRNGPRNRRKKKKRTVEDNRGTARDSHEAEKSEGKGEDNSDIRDVVPSLEEDLGSLLVEGKAVKRARARIDEGVAGRESREEDGCVDNGRKC